MKIAIFGTGYVGLVTGSSLANLGHSVICVDIDQKKIENLQNGILPFYEPGLQELTLSQVKQERLTFTTNAGQAINECEIIFNCVGTPSDKDSNADLQYVWSVINTIKANATSPKIIINKSTVPPGTARECQELLNTLSRNITHHVISNPEFLKQGNAVYDFNHPDRIVIGSNNEDATKKVHELYHGLQKTYIPIIETDWETAELIKYANNSFLATKISFINEIANIADHVGADIKVVAQAIGLDYRIGPKFLNAGIGYGGSCFPKDVKALIATAKQKNYHATLLRSVDEFNETQKKILLPKLYQEFKNRNITRPKICLLGISFKPKTSDIRGAPSVTILNELTQKFPQESISFYDPVASNEIKKLFPNIVSHKNPYDAANQADAVLILTEWDEFRNIDLTQLSTIMQTKILLDGRNIYEPETLKNVGFSYYGVGRQ